MGPHIWSWMLETIFDFGLLDFWTMEDGKFEY
jgi:hypothetical protein